jgi:hypothetical protein
MPTPGRKRASLVLLLVLAAGLAAAGAAAASGTQDMACCPMGSEMEARGCTWLGASDCCAERPTAPAPPSAAPPGPPICPALILPAASSRAIALAPVAPTLPTPLRTVVLRL